VNGHVVVHRVDPEKLMKEPEQEGAPIQKLN
jgi:hypothetical protein